MGLSELRNKIIGIYSIYFIYFISYPSEVNGHKVQSPAGEALGDRSRAGILYFCPPLLHGAQ